MASYRVPGPACASTALTPDEGTLIRTSTSAPGLVFLPPVRHWHRYSRVGGFRARDLTMSPEAVALLQSIEKLRLKAYDDHSGKIITGWVPGATIGYGHYIEESEWATYKDGVTKEQAETLFRTDAEPKETAVRSTITVGVQQYEFDAIVILTFNIGVKGFQKSTVARLVNDSKTNATGQPKLLEAAWKSFNKSRNKDNVRVVNKGLVNRRAAEWRIYTTGVYAGW